MPDPAPLPDHQAPYLKDADGARWGDVRAAGWHWRQGPPGRFELVGDCLRCGHRMGVVVNTFLAAAARAQDVQTLLSSSAVCECGQPHAGRPDTAAFQGCGAVYRGLDALELQP